MSGPEAIKKRSWFFILCMVVIGGVTLFAVGCGGSKPSISAVTTGVADLSDYDFGMGPVALKGTWRYTPDVYAAEARNIDVGGVWNGINQPSGPLPAIGSGTYRATVLLPEGRRELNLWIPAAETAAMLTINDIEFGTIGRPGTDKTTSTPSNGSILAYLGEAEGRLEIVLRVANYHHRRGGLPYAPLLGFPKDVLKSRYAGPARDIMVIVLFLITAIFNFGIVIVSGRRRSLIFAGAALMFALRMSTTGSQLLSILLPVEWGISIRIAYISFCTAVLFGLGFFSNIFPYRRLRSIRLSIYSAGSILLIALFVTPHPHFSRWIPVVHGFVAVGIGVMMLQLIARGRSSWSSLALIYTTGLAVIALTMVVDLLTYYGVASLPRMETLGYVLFTFAQWMVLMLRVRDEYHGRTRLARDMEGLVIERTEELAAANARLKTISETDPLTGVANRLRLESRLEETAREARRYGGTFSLVMSDLDHFKKVNDGYGHDTGDRVLREYARRMSDGLRDTDMMGRYGGEEFVFLLTHTDRSGAAILAERLRILCSEKEFPDVGKITCSFGVATWMDDGEDVEVLLRVADTRLYTAKEAGRDRVVTGD